MAPAGRGDRLRSRRDTHSSHSHSHRAASHCPPAHNLPHSYPNPTPYLPDTLPLRLEVPRTYFDNVTLT